MSEGAINRRPLRLLAEDADDLHVLSAALQDALTTVGEVAYEKAARRLTIALNRFCWECQSVEAVRIRAGLQLGGVLAVQSRGVEADSKARLLQILAMTFEPSPEADNPGGVVLIHLAGGGDLKVIVECVDIVLSDLSDPWPAKTSPAHEI